MTREEVIDVIKKAVDELGYVPTLDELIRTGKLKRRDMRRNFGPYRAALRSCGLEREGQGYKVSLNALFLDWAGLIRKLAKVPSILDYELHGKYSVKPFTRHFGGWLNIPGGFMHYAQEHGLEGEWKSELDIVAQYLQTAPVKARNSSCATGWSSKPRIRLDEPIYGPPMAPTHLLLAPVNEQGVIFLFGAVAQKLGFAVLHLQSGYPDCEALREIEPGRWQRVRIELEYESRNFLAHLHDPQKCQLIVCWEHNWPECPLEVVELKSAVKNIG